MSENYKLTVMKELSIEEKAKRYDEAIERAKEFKEHLLEINDKGYADEMDYIFPELKESEDERIRKALYKAIWTYIPTEEGQEYIAWLEKQSEKESITCPICGWEIEKQGEQKPAWSEEYERNLNDVILFIETGTYSLDKDNLINWLKSLRPQNRWKQSDEQINAFDAVLVYNPPCSNECRNHLITLYNDLKKLMEE